MTGAEWIRFRFGEGRGAQLAHLIVVLFALINVIGFLAYGFHRHRESLPRLFSLGSSPRILILM